MAGMNMKRKTPSNFKICDNNLCLTKFDRRIEKRTLTTFHSDGIPIPILSLKKQTNNQICGKLTYVSSVRLEELLVKTLPFLKPT